MHAAHQEAVSETLRLCILTFLPAMVPFLQYFLLYLGLEDHLEME